MLSDDGDEQEDARRGTPRHSGSMNNLVRCYSVLGQRQKVMELRSISNLAISYGHFGLNVDGHKASGGAGRKYLDTLSLITSI